MNCVLCRARGDQRSADKDTKSTRQTCSTFPRQTSATPQPNRQQDFDRQAINHHNLFAFAPLEKEYGDAAQHSAPKACSTPTLCSQALSPTATATSETPGRHLGSCHCLSTEDALLAANKQECARRLGTAPGNAASVSCIS